MLGVKSFEFQTKTSHIGTKIGSRNNFGGNEPKFRI